MFTSRVEIAEDTFTNGNACPANNFNFVLTFPTQDEMQVALNDHGEFDLSITDLRKWNQHDYYETKKVWLEIFGVPQHGWKCKNFKRIAELWGRLICLGKPITRTNSFESMKVFIVTTIFSTIMGTYV